MAFGSVSKAGVMTRALGQLVGLLLALYVFDEILDAIWGTINTSTYFSTAVTFVENLLPVVGILGAFGIIYNALRQLGLL